MKTKNDVRFSSFSERVGAFFIDWAIFAFFLLMVMIVAKKSVSYMPLFFPFFMFILITSNQLMKKGATIGERFFNLKTLTIEYEKLSPGQAITRQIFLIVISFIEMVLVTFVSYLTGCPPCLLLFIFLAPVTQMVYEALSKTCQIGKKDFKYSDLFVAKLILAGLLSIGITLAIFAYELKGANFHA